ncbi:type I polyketide synthase [Actinoplanes sp. NPDC026619]|uniref:type I polyketide synthase n=1 Tax=Actinoplanes sp. NPDC026619 TaxID=3155798 RepID=UPI0033C38135
MPSPIAVIGMAGRFPGAMDIDAFWENLVNGRDCITDLDDEDLLRRGEYPEYLAHPNYVRRRPCLPAADMFDARCFGMTPREAEIRDPQQRVLLEIAHSALEHAGYDPARHRGAIGVFAGTNINRYRMDHLEQDATIRATVPFLALEIANAPDYVATFLSHRLGLTGPSMTLQTACSTGLTAVRTAAHALAAGECDMALAGVCSIEMPLDYGYLQMEGSILARDGRPKPFDADADGTNFGSGCGVLLLKPLDAAIADRDTVHAVIVGAALNNDGSRKSGFTAPSIEGQAECIAEAIHQAGIHPRDISYVEAHGTATRLGDPIEVAGLAEAFRRAAGDSELPRGYCSIGSVKSNIGHVGQASGAAGLIKTVLALSREQIPPSINVTRVNPRLKLEDTPFRVATDPQLWPRTAGAPRTAGVSSFGIGGTNGHVVLSEAPEAAPSSPAGRPSELIVWSGADAGAADGLAQRLSEHLGALDPAGFADAAHTLRVGRAERRFRRALVARDAGHAARALLDGDGLIVPDGPARQPIFCFPGQGTPLGRAGLDLYDAEPVFRDHVDKVLALLRTHDDTDLAALWRAGDAALAGTAVAQPLLFALEYAIASTLIDLGVRPAKLIGHSVGELVAATVAGVFTLADGVRAVTARGALMGRMPAGAMLAVAADAADVEAHLTDEVCLAAINGARQSVLSGPAGALSAFAEKLRADGIESTPVPTAYAFHSAAMEPAAAEFEAVLASMPLRPPAIPVFSCATGAPMTGDEAVSPAFWARQLVTPVRFAAAVTTALADGPAFLVETGPGHTLTRLLRTEPAVRAGQSLPIAALDADAGAATAFDRLLGRLWVEGHAVDFERRDARTGRRRVPVVGYPYQRRRFWVDRPAGHKPPRDNSMIVDRASQPVPDEKPAETKAVRSSVEAAPVVLADAPPQWSLGAVEWSRRPAAPAPPTVRRAAAAHAVLVLPDDPEPAATVRGAFQRSGYRTTRANAATLATGGDAAWDVLLGGAAPISVLACAGLFGTGPGRPGDDLDRQLSSGFFAVLDAARALARTRPSRPVTLAILTSFAVDVTGAEPVDPAAAMVVALARSIEQELPPIRCVVLDAPPGTAEHDLGAALAEFGEPLVALRGATTWTPGLRRMTPEPATDLPQLRENGVYLITGGLGGLGSVVAAALADTGLRPRIALMGRTVPDCGPRAAHVGAMLEDAGAEVMTVAGDVTDAASLGAAVEAVRRRFGPLNGIIHAAGTPGGGLLQHRSRAEIDSVLAPKVGGAMNLLALCDQQADLDFLLFFSSHAGLAGMLGSADYAAANAFLDALAVQHGRGRRRVCSVVWPGWSEVGMWAKSAVDLDAVTHGRPGRASSGAGENPGAGEGSGAKAEPDWRTTLDAGADWVLDEHRFDGVPMLPGTGSLEVVVRAALERGLAPDGEPLELREAVFVAPVNGERPIEVGVAFTPGGDEFRFRLMSRAAGAGGPWTHHVSGYLARGRSEPPTPTLEELFAGHTAGDPLPSHGRLEFGPRWQSLTRLWHGEDSYLAELTLQEPFLGDLDRHPLHAALLDRAGIAILSAAFPDEPNQHLPFFYRRLTRFGALPARIVAHGRPGPAGPGMRSLDLDIHDATTGALLVRVESYTTREIRVADFARRLGRAARPEPAGPSGGPAERGPTEEGPTEEGPALLNPRDGAAAFLTVLSHRYPPVVVVNAPGALLSVRGMPWLGESVTIPVTPAPVDVPPVPVPVPPAATPAPATAGGDVLDTLRSLWIEALGVDEVGLDDDFFDLGGDSLVSVQLSARLRQIFRIEISAGVLFDASTLRVLRERLAELGVR